MAGGRLEDVISHWYHYFDDFQVQPTEFYNQLRTAVEERKIPGAKITTINMSEFGLLSGTRAYLRVSRHELMFDICAAPFGRGFFASWWLSEPPGCKRGCLTAIPIIGSALVYAIEREETTYYKIDTALMFQEAVHAGVPEVIDGITTEKGVRALAEGERKPIMDALSKKSR